MPFTLAHPAAILPLSRLCPRQLSFPALVMGSLAPDVGYVFARWQVDEYSHSLVGSAVFGLPTGALMLVAFMAARSRLVNWLPAHHQTRLLPLCRRPIGSVATIAFALLLGIWSHLIFDSFTHKGGWAVEEFAWLQHAVVTVKYHNFRVHHILWYGFSFAGVAWVCFAYDRWMRTIGAGGGPPSSVASWRNGLLIAGIFVPIQLLHHSFGGLKGNLMVGLLTLGTIVVAACVLGRGADSNSAGTGRLR